MPQYLSVSKAAQRLKHAIYEGLVSVEDTALVFYDFSVLQNRLDEVKLCFPDDFKHTVAIKSNPMAGVLSFIVENGFGLEAASFEEVVFASSLNSPLIVWNSPVKTLHEISEASAIENLTTNADSLQELRIISKATTSSKVMLRINPEVSPNADSTMTVGNAGSKFGESISNREAIIKAAVNSPYLSGLHVHSSSQTLDFISIIEGITKTLDLADEINAHRQPGAELVHFNIGGGLAANFYGQEDNLMKSFSDALLVKEGKRLAKYKVMTEFGRYYHANAGFCVSQISQCKIYQSTQTLIVHFGADMFVREVYQPGKWHHRFAVLDSNYNEKTSPGEPTKIAGPLCFGGDYLAKNIKLPAATNKDYLLMMDTGANSIGLWSRHCSRAMPKIIGIKAESGPFILKPREALNSIFRFWSE